MKYAVGIDLGSTTTKCVVLGMDEQVLGRGITNSRSNYDVACQVSLSEALINTRLSLVSAELSAAGMGIGTQVPLLEELERLLRLEQYRSQLRVLRSEIERLLDARSAVAAQRTAADHVLTRLEQEAPALYAAGASRKSDFFRDLAGERYMRLAEPEARSSNVGYDALVGLYDKAVLEVENSSEAAGRFEDHALRAVAAMGDRHEAGFTPAEWRGGLGGVRRSTPPQNDEGRPLALEQAVRRVVALELEQVASVGTGYGRARLPFPKAQIRSEILCHGRGAHAMFPGTRTVLDIGGQDTKAIQVDESGVVTSFQMNDRCAAGCGRYLGYIADEMNLGLHELGPLACNSTRTVRINSTCTVFAGAELRERLSLGDKREDILAGLHRAIILRAMSLLARSGGVRAEFTFTGGVAKNPAAVGALRDLISENYGAVQLNISPDSIYTGALGAALFALADAHRAVPAGAGLAAAPLEGRSA